MNQTLTVISELTVFRRHMEQMTYEESVEKFYQYSKERLDALVSKQMGVLSSLAPSSATEREAAANLVEFAQGGHQVVAHEEKKKKKKFGSAEMNLLMDQLKTNTPMSDLPSSDAELASLRELQRLIERRVKDLTSNSTSTAAEE